MSMVIQHYGISNYYIRCTYKSLYIVPVLFAIAPDTVSLHVMYQENTIPMS